MGRKKKKQAEPDATKSVIVFRSPGFSSRFKEDLAWWFKQDFQKALKFLDLVTAVIQDPFQGIGTEPLKYLNADIWLWRIDLEYRLLYQVGNTQINFLTCRYHYE